MHVSSRTDIRVMNYFSRVREDGKFDVLEGTPDEPGRIVTCFDTMEDAAAYIAEQSAIFDELFDRITELENEEAPMTENVVDNTLATNSTNVVGGNIIVTPLDTQGIPIVAHAEPPTPPMDFFAEPPVEFQRRYTTVTDDGRVMGLVATFLECHVGYGDRCITAPREADYSHFAVGTVLTSDGTTIPTGVIAIKGGHADIGLDAASARSHYDDTNSGIVDVVVGSSDKGIWFSGALRPGATPEQVQALRASGVSGDWRLIDGELRLVGICAVNVPGFPKLSVAASADGITALVAAGGPPEPHPDLCGCKDSTTDILEELDYLHKIVADAGLEDAAIEKLAARILTDDDIDTLYERIVAT